MRENVGTSISASTPKASWPEPTYSSEVPLSCAARISLRLAPAPKDFWLPVTTTASTCVVSIAESSRCRSRMAWEPQITRPLGSVESRLTRAMGFSRPGSTGVVTAMVTVDGKDCSLTRGSCVRSRGGVHHSV